MYKLNITPVCSFIFIVQIWEWYQSSHLFTHTNTKSLSEVGLWEICGCVEHVIYVLCSNWRLSFLFSCFHILFLFFFPVPGTYVPLKLASIKISSYQAVPVCFLSFSWVPVELAVMCGQYSAAELVLHWPQMRGAEHFITISKREISIFPKILNHYLKMKQTIENHVGC